MITCPICEFENRDEEYCNQCGAKLEGLAAASEPETPAEVEPIEVAVGAKEPIAEAVGAKEPIAEANEPNKVPSEANEPNKVPSEIVPVEEPVVEAEEPQESSPEAEAPEKVSTEVSDVCAGCQKMFTGDEKFCPGCGQPREEAPALKKPDEEVVKGPRLILLQNDDEIKSYPVAESEPLTIGRLETNTISFPEDGYTSSNHAKVELADGEYFIEDLDSTNGTLIKIKRYRLSPGDIIFIGSNTFKFDL